MEDLNNVILIGRVVKDCELKYSQKQTAFAKISLAVNGRKVGDEDICYFFDVSIFGKTAENLSKYLLKGTKIAVQGHLSQNRWEKDGQKHSSIGIMAQSIELLGSKNDGQKQQPKQQAQDFAESPASEPMQFEEDIPF